MMGKMPSSGGIAILARALLFAALAAVSPTFPFFLIVWADPVAVVVSPGAFLAALGLGVLIGLPGYLLFRRMGWANYGTAALCGACAGMAFPFWSVQVGLWGERADGWAEAERWLPFFATLGGAAGLVFHLVATGLARKGRR